MVMVVSKATNWKRAGASATPPCLTPHLLSVGNVSTSGSHQQQVEGECGARSEAPESHLAVWMSSCPSPTGAAAVWRPCYTLGSEARAACQM